jgi:hypothetical protein
MGNICVKKGQKIEAEKTHDEQTFAHRGRGKISFLEWGGGGGNMVFGPMYRLRPGSNQKLNLFFFSKSVYEAIYCRLYCTVYCAGIRACVNQQFGSVSDRPTDRIRSYLLFRSWSRNKTPDPRCKILFFK